MNHERAWIGSKRFFASFPLPKAFFGTVKKGPLKPKTGAACEKSGGLTGIIGIAPLFLIDFALETPE